MLIFQTFKYQELIILRLPLYFVIFDAFYILGPFSYFGTIRNILILTLILFLLFKTYPYIFKNHFLIIVLLLYFLFRTIYSSSSILASINAYITFSIPILLYPISIKVCKTQKELFFLLKNTFNAILFFSVFMVISDWLKIGFDQYSGGFDSGFTFEKIFFLSFGLLTLPLYLIYIQPHKKLFTIMVFILSLILIIINMNRSSLIIIGIGAIIYLIFKRNKTKQIIYILTLFIFSIAGLYLVRDTLLKQYNARLEIIEKRAGLENEGRFMEFQLVIPESIAENTVYFGKEAFNSTGNYGNGIFDERPLHVDLVIIFFGFGLIGIIIFLLFYYNIFRNIFIYKMYKEKSLFYNLLFILFVSLIIGRAAVLFSGGLLVLSYNSLVFIFLGVIVSLFKTRYMQYQITKETLL